MLEGILGSLSVWWIWLFLKCISYAEDSDGKRKGVAILNGTQK